MSAYFPYLRKTIKNLTAEEMKGTEIIALITNLSPVKKILKTQIRQNALDKMEKAGLSIERINQIESAIKNIKGKKIEPKNL